ncbi:MAG: phage portal protein family protein [Pseudomonadota bacterium]
MVNFTKQDSYPVHIENTIHQLGKEDLKLSNQFKTYRRMMEDPVVSGSISFIKSIMNVPFKLEAPLRATQKEKRVIEALNKSLETMEPYSLNRVMNHILSLVEYGTSLQEVVFERKNGYQVFSKFSPISLQSVDKYVYDRGELKKLILAPPENDGIIQNITKAPKEIDGSKVLAFQFQADSDNPLGKSLLRGCYSVHKERETYRELGLVGASKSLAGVMRVEAPSEYLTAYFNDPNSDQAILVESMRTQAELMGQGRSSLIVIPSDATDANNKLFAVEPIKGVDRQGFEIEASIARCSRELIQALQVSVLSLGQDDTGSSGSFALSSTKSMLLHSFLKSIQDTIAAEFQKAIKIAYKLNGLTDERLPKVKFEDMSKPNWTEFTEGMKSLGQSGLVEPSGELSEYILGHVGAPTQGGTGATGDLMNRARQRQEDRQEEVNNDAE